MSQEKDRLSYIRKDTVQRIDPDNKTDEEKARGRLDRAQLYLFLTEIAASIRRGLVLVSRMTPNHFWCQTGFVIKDNVVYGKYGDSQYQPVGWDTGEEFYPLDIAKLLWKHEFAWVNPTESPAESPWDVEVEEVELDDVDDPDGSALTDAERKAFVFLQKSLKEELDWVPPSGWKRSPNFEPRSGKPKYSMQDIMDKTSDWLSERQETFEKEAHEEADKILASIKHIEEMRAAGEDVGDHAMVTHYESIRWTGDAEKPDFNTWLLGFLAEEKATAASSAFAKSLREETAEYTEEEIDELARREEHDFRVRETVKMCALKSERFDRKITRIIKENPGVGDELQNIDIQGFAAQCLDWIRMRLDEDEAARVVMGTTVTPRIRDDQLEEVESRTIAFLVDDLASVRAAIADAGGIDALKEDDKVVYEAHAVISQFQSAVPAARKCLESDVDITVDIALDRLDEFCRSREAKTSDE